MKIYIIHTVIALLLISFNAKAVEQEAMERSERIYIAGFVTNESGVGISDVNIIIEHNNRKLMTLRTIQDGWFESVRSLPILNNAEIRLTLIKSGYKFTQFYRNVNKDNPIFELELQPLINFPPIDSNDTQVTMPLYGYIKLPQTEGGGGLGGARITLYKDSGKIASQPKNIIDIAFSRDSGFFSIFYDSNLRNNDTVYNYRIDHPKYNVILGKTKLTPQTEPLFVDSVVERYFEIAWFIRLGLDYQFGEKITNSVPFSSHINVLRLVELAMDLDFVSTSKPYEPSIYITNYNNRDTDVGALMFGLSFKPEGVAQRKKLVMDFAIGVSDIEINKEAKHITKFPHLQFGLSHYYKDYIHNNFSVPHIRLGGAMYQDHMGWNYLVEVNLGL